MVNYREPALRAEDLLHVAVSGKVFAVERATGNEVWMADVSPAKGVMRLTVDNGRVYVLGAQSQGDTQRLACFDLFTGRALWHADVTATAILVDDERVLVGGGGGLVWAFSAETGRLLWEKSFPHVIGHVSLAIIGLPSTLTSA